MKDLNRTASNPGFRLASPLHAKRPGVGCFKFARVPEIQSDYKVMDGPGKAASIEHLCLIIPSPEAKYPLFRSSEGPTAKNGSPFAMAEESGKTFFSYARQDSEFVLRLVKDLRAAGADVWLDQLDIGLGQHWDTAIENALGACPRHVSVLSPAAVTSQNVLDEISFALEEQKQVIPLLYRECTIPFRLRRLQWVDFRTDYESGFKELAHALGIRNASAAPAEAMDRTQRPSATSPQAEAGKHAGADAQAAELASAVEQPRSIIAVNETASHEDRGKPAGQPVGTGQRIERKSGILWALGAGLIIVVVLIWAISSSKAPDTSSGSVQVTPTATPTPVPSSTPDNSQGVVGDAEDFYQRGKDLYKRKQYDQAIDVLTQAIRLKPDYAEAFSERGLAYVHKDDYDRAIQDYTQALKLNPDYALAYNNRGNAYIDKGNYDQAIQDLNQALKLNPSYAHAYNNRGNAYLDKGDYDRAIQDYTQALKLDHNYTHAYYNRGNAYLGKGDYDRAIQDYTQALKLDQNYTRAYNNRGNAYIDKGDCDRAIQDLNQALKLDPNANSYSSRGVAYECKKQYKQALQDFDRALQIDPNVKNAQENRDRVAGLLKAQGGP